MTSIPSKLDTFQPMPDLAEEQYAALREDIQANGVIVPIVVDQHGRTLDGHNRQRIAAELAIECPSEIRKVENDDEAMGLALTLNCARRHLTREQVREVVRREIERCPYDSDRAIARRVGCSPSTVGATRRADRRDEVSNLDSPTMDREEAERVTAEIREHLVAARESLWVLISIGIANNVSSAEIVTALVQARKTFETVHGGTSELTEVFRVAVFDPLLDFALDPQTAKDWPLDEGHEWFMAEPDKVRFLQDIVAVGGGLGKVEAK